MSTPKLETRERPKNPYADILRSTVQTLEITVRAARRCAYDLSHCANDLMVRGKDPEMARIYVDRAQFFVGLFQSGNAMKDYRHRLYEQIEDLEYKLEQLRAILKEHKIDDPTLLMP